MSTEVRAETRKGPWGPLATTLFTVLVAAFFTAVQIVVAVPYVILKVTRSPNRDIQGAARALQTDGLFFGLAELLGGGAALGLTILLIWIRRGPRLREYLALRPVARVTILLWLLYTVLLGVLLDGLAYMAGYREGPKWMLDVYRSASLVPLFLFSVLVVSVLVVAPVLEEVVFRGFLFEGIRHSLLKDIGAILLVSAIWASVHVQYEWFYVGQIFAFGILLGAARLRTGSLIPPMLMHALFSGVATLQVALLVPAPIAPTSPSTSIPRNAPLGSDRKQETSDRMAWARKHILLSYDQIGLKDPKWDDAARRFIAHSLPSVAGGDGVVPAEQRITAGRAIVDHGCKDPLVLYLLGKAIFDGTWDSAEPEYFLAQAVEGMKTVPYPRALARWAASALYGRYEWRREGIGLRKALGPLELKWFQQSLVDGSFEPGDSLVLLFQLDNGTGPDFLERSSAGAAAALERATWVEPWVRLCFLGVAHHHEAWAARGHGWAKDVKPDAWKRFASLNAQARHELVEAWKLRPDRSETAYYMMGVAEDDPVPGESPRLWFDRTVAARLDGLGAYDDMLRQLLPRWGGSYEEMLAFGREALDTGRFDTDVPLYALRAVTKIYDDQKDETAGAGGAPIYERPETYPLLVQVLEGYLKEPKQAGNRARFESLWAIVADHARKPQEALAHLHAGGFHLTSEAAGHLEDETRDEFAARIALAAGAGAADARRGDSSRLAFERGDALQAYRAALVKDPSPRTAPALRRWVAALETEQRLDRGDWVPILPQSDALDGWRPLLGGWNVEKDGALTGRAGARGLLIVSDARVGPSFEMKGRVEMVASTNGFFQVGFVLGHPAWEKDNWFSFRVKRNAREGTVAYFTRSFFGPEGVAPTVEVHDVNDILIRVEDGRMTAFVNGRAVEENFGPTAGWESGDRGVLVGLGGYPDENLWSVRFRGVQVRRLAK